MQTPFSKKRTANKRIIPVNSVENQLSWIFESQKFNLTPKLLSRPSYCAWALFGSDYSWIGYIIALQT